MSNLFNVERPLMQILVKLTDLVLLNLLFLVTALPIVTIGAAWTSLLASWQKILRGHDNQVALTYLQLFRENLKQGTLLWGITVLFGGIFFMDYLLLQQATGVLRGIGLFILMPFVLLLLAGSTVWFAYIGRYRDTLKQVIKNAFLILINCFPWVVLASGINGGLLYFAISSPERLLTTIYSCTFFGFSAVALINALIMKKVFGKIEQEKK